MPDYGNVSYWDERYAAEENKGFDWYIDYQRIKPYLMPYLRKAKDFEILYAGCGNSGTVGCFVLFPFCLSVC